MKSTRFLGWVALGLVAGAAVIHCGGDDSGDSTPPGGGGQAGSHAGSSGTSGSSGSLNTGGGASGASGASQNTGGMGGAAGTAGGAGTGGTGGTGGAPTGDSSPGDSSSTTDARDAATNDAASNSDVATSSDASSADVTSNDAGSINDSAAAADGDGGLCPANVPANDTSCPAPVATGCAYGQQRCFCQRPFGAGADAGRVWQCYGPPPAEGGVADAGANCPGARPEGGMSCSNPGLFCRYTANTLCICSAGAQDDWVCFSF